MTQWQSVKKDRALSSDKKINPNFIAQKKLSFKQHCKFKKQMQFV